MILKDVYGKEVRKVEEKNGETHLKAEKVWIGKELVGGVTRDDLKLMKQDPKTFWKDIISIGDSAFEDNTAIREIVVPEEVRYIGSYAFFGCTNLEKVTVLGDIKEVKNETFYNCNKLKKVDFAKKAVKSIGDEAFYGCDALKEFDISTVTSIGNGAFRESGLTEFCPSIKLKTIGERAFTDCANLEKAYIPLYVEDLEEGLFEGCENLAEVEFEANGRLTKVGTCAFSGCKSLKNVVLPNAVEDIGDYAFEGCEELANIEIPTTLTYLGKGAFEGCEYLMAVSIPTRVLR